MKKNTAILSVLVLSASLFSAASFANMSITGPALPAPAYYGPIKSVTYSPITQSVTVVVDATSRDNPFNGHVGLVSITFDGPDLAFGSSINASVGLQGSFIVGASNLVQCFNVSSS